MKLTDLDCANTFKKSFFEIVSNACGSGDAIDDDIDYSASRLRNDRSAAPAPGKVFGATHGKTFGGASHGKTFGATHGKTFSTAAHGKIFG